MGAFANGSLRGTWPPILQISHFLPFAPCFCLFRPFLKSARGAPGKSGERRMEAFFLRFASTPISQTPTCGTPIKIRCYGEGALLESPSHQCSPQRGEPFLFSCSLASPELSLSVLNRARRVRIAKTENGFEPGRGEGLRCECQRMNCLRTIYVLEPSLGRGCDEAEVSEKKRLFTE